MPKKILIVEDEEEIVILLTGRLKTQGYEVINASDGLSGLEKARNENPDLILLDVNMPKMNGYEVCRMLKFDETYQTVPVIMLTARNQEQDQCIGKEVGADAYITKPFDQNDLIVKIKEFIGE